MRSAHQGIAPAALLGLTSAGWMPALPGNYGAGAQGGPASPRPPQPEQGLDTWLLDKLFGRH